MIPNLDSEYWNARYRQNETGWDTGAITTPLKQYFDQLTNKDLFILIPGAGNGYEAEYLLKQGFKNVYVCDIAPEPLAALRKRCPDFEADRLMLEDFFSMPLPAEVDANKGFDIIIEQAFFCALNPILRKKYFRQMNTLLNDKGKLVGLLFNERLNTDKPPFGGDKEEYFAYFRQLFSINKYELCHNSIKPREGRELFLNLSKKINHIGT